MVKIVSTYQYRKEETRYSRQVSLQEIKENEYNLNITRYVNLSKEEERIDLLAVNRELKKIDEQIEKACCIDGSKLITGWRKRWKYFDKKGVLQ